ncbi:hypothetical protein Q3G72_008705 [Acer saccharum]|nr:hypothetical protein Q3G72_008705 [Acer saccharum]
MVRSKTVVAKGPSLAADNKSKNQRLSSAERSAYFARREAAKEISLAGDAEKFLTLRKEAIQSALARLLVR